VSNRDLALALARDGVAVFPCQWAGEDAKKPLRGVYWRKVSTTDARQIERWWTAHPEALPAIDLAKIGRVVIDCDAPRRGEADGVAWFAELGREHELDIEQVPGAVTGSGGRHLYFRQPAGKPIGNERGTLPPRKEVGVDVRGAGGYVIAAGASLPDGRIYQARGSLGDAPDMPAWLEAILRGKANERLDAAPSPQPAAQAAPSQPIGSGDPFFRAVNDLALRNLSAWVPTIFGSTARYQSSTGAYRVSSKALGRNLEEDLSLAPTGIIDFGVHDMGDHRQGRRTAIDVVIEQGRARDAREAALWLCDRLGRDPVSLGYDGGASPGRAALGAAAARNLVEQVDGSVIDMETGEVVSEPDKPSASSAPASAVAVVVPKIPGLVGEIADWITATARRPQPALSLGAALTVVGTAIGRDVAGPTLSGTHLYVIALAPTGAGKDHPLQQCGRLLRAAGMGHHLGPSEFISMTSVVNLLKRSPLALCAQDEFGAFLKRVNARKASNFEGGTLKILRTVWGSSFQPMMTPEWAKETAVQVVAPAISLFGCSTEEEFYAALEGLDKDNGVLNRFMIVSAPTRTSERDPLYDPFNVPALIGDGLKRLYTRSGAIAASLRNAPTMDMKPVVLNWGADQAKELYDTFRTEIEERSDADPTENAFLARTVETAIRIATIIAAGRFSNTVDYDDMQLGKELALTSAAFMIRGAREHMAETETEAAGNRIVRTIKKHGGKISKRDLLRTMRYLKKNELEPLLRSLMDAEVIAEIKKEPTTAGGRPQFFYINVR
jgi:hypothetical protein